jgi:hypothetical protein
MTRAEFEFNKDLCQQEIADAKAKLQAGDASKAQRVLAKAIEQNLGNTVSLLLTGLERFVDSWVYRGPQ